METYVKSYFRETSVHGFRYIVEGRNWLERLSWILVLASCFALSSKMVHDSVTEAVAHPVATSVDSVPVQELFFPAVTVRPAKANHFYRYLEGVLSAFKFDCMNKEAAEERTACKDDTAVIKSDFRNIVGCLLLALYEKAMESGESELIDWNRQICKSGIFVNGDEIQALYSFLEYVEANLEDEALLGPQLMTLALEAFRQPRKDVVERVEEFVEDKTNETRRSVIGGGGFLFQVDCIFKLSQLGLSTQTKVVGAAFLESQGGAGASLQLGQLLGKSYDSIGLFELDEASVELIGSFQKVYDSLVAGSEVSVEDLLYYVFKEYVGGLGVQAEKGDFFDDCNVNHELSLKKRDGDHSLFCSEDEASSCCPLEKAIQGDYGTLLKVLKYTLQPTARFITEKSEVRDISEATSHFPSYPLVEKFTNNDPTILACKFGGRMDLSTDCKLFAKSFTTSGVGYTFNAAPFWKMYQGGNPATEAFHEEVHSLPGLEGHLLPRKTEFNGPAFALEAFVKHSDKASFAIHNPMVIPDLRNEAVELAPGMTYTVYVTPRQVSSDESVIDMKEGKRKCKTSEDNGEMRIFANYTQSGCLFECQLRVPLETCGCIPWDYPRFDESIPVCHSVGSECFEQLMSHPVGPDDCGCPSDCTATSYEYHVLLQKTNSEALCSRARFRDSLGVSRYVRNDLFVLDSLEEKAGSEEALCVKEMGTVSVLRVHVAPRFANRIARTSRVTFAGQLANLGGVIGLFTGMSILSLYEVLFWMARVLGAVGSRWTAKKYVAT